MWIGIKEIPVRNDGIGNNSRKIIIRAVIDGNVPAFLEALKERGVLGSGPEAPGAIRMVTHYGINREDIQEALSAIAAVAKERLGGGR